MKWHEKNKKRVRAILDAITANTSQAELARQLKLTSRAIVSNWRRRGQIPLEHHAEIIKLAADVGVKATPGELNPMALLVERNAAATPVMGVRA